MRAENSGAGVARFTCALPNLQNIPRNFLVRLEIPLLSVYKLSRGQRSDVRGQTYFYRLQLTSDLCPLTSAFRALPSNTCNDFLKAA